MKKILLALVISFGVNVNLPGVGLAQDAIEVGDRVADDVGEDSEIWDPAESVNRAIFSFNDTMDVYLLEPVAKGYDSVVPDSVQASIGNFFENLSYPSYLVSDLVQLKFGQVGTHTGRFLVNSTVGVLGLFDVAKDMGLPSHKEDFGVALAYHCVPSGPYIMLPFFGPSNLRDGVGRIVDFFLDPLGALSYSSLDSGSQFGLAAAGGLRVVDQRAGLIDAIKGAKESSLDYYMFVQSSYYQYRRGLLNDGSQSGDKEGTYAGSAHGEHR